MESKWLHDFVSLANTGNFSRSAEERHVTQSAFSRRIQALENWLGTELFDRKTHPVTLTDSGIRFLTHARNMIHQAERIRNDFADTRADCSSVLTFNASTNLAMTFLPKWLTDIQADFGRFDVKVQTDISGIHDHFEALRSNNSDFLLHYGHGVGMLAMDASKFEFKVIGHDLLVPVYHRSLHEIVVQGTQKDSKVPLPYISPWRTSPVANLIAETITQNSPSLRLGTVVESSIIGCTKGFVAQGAGIAWLPISAVHDELSSGEFLQLSDESFQIPLSIELYRSASDNNIVAIKLWEYIRQLTD